MKGHSTYHQSTENLPSFMVSFTRKFSHSELAIYYRITQLTGIVLDSRVATMGNEKFSAPILPVDFAEALFARRTLHE